MEIFFFFTSVCCLCQHISTVAELYGYSSSRIVKLISTEYYSFGRQRRCVYTQIHANLFVSLSLCVVCLLIRIARLTSFHSYVYIHADNTFKLGVCACAKYPVVSFGLCECICVRTFVYKTQYALETTLRSHGSLCLAFSHTHSQCHLSRMRLLDQFCCSRCVYDKLRETQRTH